MAKKSTTPLPVVIAERLREAIIEGEMAFGEHLSEDILAEVFGVSRTPVREAFNRLQMEGLVQVVPKSGTYVLVPTAAGTSELCDFRAELEVSAWKLRPREQDTQLRESFRREIDEMAHAMEARDFRAYGRADSRFHLALVAASANRHLVEAYQRIFGRIAALRTHLASNAPGEPDRSFEDHRKLLELVAAERCEAFELLANHILRTKQNYAAAFSDNRIQTADRRFDLKRKLGLEDASELPLAQ